jgi:membrane associated rhomboid family serine protease
MPRFGSTPLAFPEFAGATRKLVLANIVTFFGLLIAAFVSAPAGAALAEIFALTPSLVLHRGFLWQLVTYSFVHAGVLGTAFELLSLWFLGRILEGSRGGRWMLELYFVSTLGAALAALAIYAGMGGMSAGRVVSVPMLAGSFGGIFGLLVAIGSLHGDLEFLLFFFIGMKARYMAALYILIVVAELFFGGQRYFAFAQLGGALAGWLYLRYGPRRGMGFATSEGWYGLRNSFYRWKRRRAARKFEVYMRKQGRDVRFDREGRYIDPDDGPRRPNGPWRN